MKTNSFKRLLTIYLLLIFGIIPNFTSCVQTKQIVYFQGDTTSYLSLKTPTAPIRVISPNDILAIIVTSLDESSNLIFNAPNINNLTYSNFSSSSMSIRSQPMGYFIDSLGFTNMPLVGRVKLSGLTVNKAADSVKVKLEKYLKNPSVSIRILNHKFSILGEVNRPGVYNMVDEKITITEALGIAGDLTIFGKRENILLIRELKDKGQTELVRLDLRNRDIFQSKYFYLEPNDVLYVEPLKTKATATDQNYQLVPIFTGIASALGILILNLRK